MWVHESIHGGLGRVSETQQGEECVHVKELSGMRLVKRTSTWMVVVVSAVEESLH